MNFEPTSDVLLYSVMDPASTIRIYCISAYELYEMTRKYGDIRYDANFQSNIMACIAERNKLSLNAIDREDSVRNFMITVQSFCKRLSRTKSKRNGRLWTEFLAALRTETVEIPLVFNDLLDINAQLRSQLRAAANANTELSRKLLDHYVLQQQNDRLKQQLKTLKMKYGGIRKKNERGPSLAHRLGLKSYCVAHVRRQRLEFIKVAVTKSNIFLLLKTLGIHKKFITHEISLQICILISLHRI